MTVCVLIVVTMGFELVSLTTMSKVRSANKLPASVTRTVKVTVVPPSVSSGAKVITPVVELTVALVGPLTRV